MAGLPERDGLQIVVNRESALCPSGWIGIVVIGDTITASVPSTDLEAPVFGALGDLGPSHAFDPSRLLQRLPPMSEVLGPARLFYAGGPLPQPPVIHAVHQASPEDFERLLGTVAKEDRDESGVAALSKPAFVVRAPDGVPTAIGDYRPWPQRVAHVCVLTIRHTDVVASVRRWLRRPSSMR